ncbi:MAG: hypothetical protein FJW96_13065, partial [Actinobacteria bacterium]|nr:hypothetical protein [Actinomycetota bacterium]
MLDRRTRVALRTLGAVLVVAWFVFEAVRARLPFWVPFAVLLAVEVEFAAGGLLEARRGVVRERSPARGAPGEADADLGWGDVVEEIDEHGDPVVRWVPPPQRPPARRGGVAYVLAGLVAAGLLGVAYLVDREASWSSLSAAERTATETRLEREAGRIADKPVRVRCDDGYSYTGIGSDALGVAFPDRGLAFLQPSVCRTIHDALHGKRPTS